MDAPEAGCIGAADRGLADAVREESMKKIVPEYEFTAEERARVRALASACGLHELTAAILYSRGIDTPEKAERFLSPSAKYFLSPFLMRGMRELTDAIAEVRASGGLVAVYGDYDADGIGAAAILLSALRRFGVRAVAHVPERAEGYGMSVSSLEKIIDEYAPSLIVTVDCGVSNRAEAEYIKSRGVRVIVTDHHELPERLPDCTVVNPKLADDYPYDNLCGAGVAFKIACALLGKDAYDLLDIAAVSTVADSVPLTGENRDIVFEGLRRINKNPRAALKYLLASKKDAVDAQTLAFTVAPRINAAGRMGDAQSALRLLTSEDEKEVYDLAVRLNAFNAERQQVCDEVYKSARAKLAEGGAYDDAILLYGEDWSQGLIGIVAARLAEEFNRPVVLFAEKDGLLKGSARTVENVNVYEALRACAEHLEAFGGHAQAAGVTVRKENFEALRAAMNAYIRGKYATEDFQPSFAVCAQEMPSAELVRELERLEPCGVGNKKPLFAVSAGSVAASPLKEGSPHVAFRAEGTELVWFGGGRSRELLSCDVPKEIVFECGLSRFRGTESVRGIVRDVLCAQEGGACTELYLFRAALRRLAAKPVQVNAVYESAEKIERRIAAAREACRYGLLLLGGERVPAPLAGVCEGLEGELFRLAAPNVGNALVLTPAADEDFSMYREVVFLETPADFHIASLGGRTVYVNADAPCTLFDGLDTSREALAAVYRAVRAGVAGEDSVSAALAQEEFPPRQFVFAAEVFAELGLVRTGGGMLRAAGGKRTELAKSAIYRAAAERGNV